MNKLTHIKLTKAVLGTLNQKAAGSINGIIDHLKNVGVHRKGMNSMKKWTHIRDAKAVLGTLNRKAAGYMSGIMDHLETKVYIIDLG